MQAELITIGDEILIGQIVDTNSAWMGQQLNFAGLDVARIWSISDDKSTIINALENLYPETKLVIITGGLGPTKDDLTKNTLAELFGMELTYRPEVYAHIEQLFASMGRLPASNNKEQAMLPDGCRVLQNMHGTAPGMLFCKDDKYIFSLPGVPYEMKHLMESQVLPIVASEMLRQHILHRTILTVGVPESELSERLEDFEAEMPSGIKLAYLPRPGLVRLRLTAKGKVETAIVALIESTEAKLRAILGDVVYGSNEDRLEQVIGNLLVAQGETIATAESCSGGFIAHLLTSIAGSSRYFMGSVVAYDNKVKINQLGVDKDVLEEFGAVSKEVVVQMAEGVRAKLETTWALATSGIAGPDGGTETKPVGTVWIALAGPEGTEAHKFQFGKDRERNIKKSAFTALNLLRTALIGKTN